jgi:tetratricopeptide (TPR) repeat protein
MIQRSRTPAVLVLLLTILAATGYVWSTRAEDRTTRGQVLAQLERAIANPDASTETWLRYAQCLQQEQRFDHAVMAYQRVLETDPDSRTANLQCAATLAQLGDADRLHGFLSRLIQLDPRLALDVFGRPELQRHLKQDRFQSLLNQARIQSLD